MERTNKPLTLAEQMKAKSLMWQLIAEKNKKKNKEKKSTKDLKKPLD